jgi:hypothetical protein
MHCTRTHPLTHTLTPARIISVFLSLSLSFSLSLSLCVSLSLSLSLCLCARVRVCVPPSPLRVPIPPSPSLPLLTSLPPSLYLPRTVLSAPYYLNAVNQGSNLNEDWPWYYAIDPTDFPPPASASASAAAAASGAAAASWGQRKQELVTGVEAFMWSEWVDSSNFIPPALAPRRCGG